MSLHKYTKKFSFQESKGSFTLDAGIGIHRWIASTQRAADLALHRRHQLSDRKYYIIQQHATIHCKFYFSELVNFHLFTKKIFCSLSARSGQRYGQLLAVHSRAVERGGSAQLVAGPRPPVQGSTQ